MQPHGIDAYLRERARFERRLATVVAGVSAGAATVCGLVLLLSALEYARTGRPPERGWPEFFGFEGREQYVRRIYLETTGPPGPRPGRPTIYFPSVTAQKGGRAPIASSDEPHARPDTRRVGEGPGRDPAPTCWRARASSTAAVPPSSSPRTWSSRNW